MLIRVLLCRVQLNATLSGFFWPLPLLLGLYHGLFYKEEEEEG